MDLASQLCHYCTQHHRANLRIVMALVGMLLLTQEETKKPEVEEDIVL